MPISVVQQVMHQLQPWQSASGWCVAFSGGLDSTVLLHVLATQIPVTRRPPLRAVYIAHGLQTAAETWPQHCREQCQKLGVELSVWPVHVPRQASIEQAARTARYAAFTESLAVDEVLLLAQHQDDQAETLLFRLLRGSGVAGLQAMQGHRELGQGHLLRPLLGIARQRLEGYARHFQLNWIEDPSNADDQVDRNFLRLHALPLLRQRWPGLLRVFSRTAEHMREAQELLDELAQMDVQAATVAQPLAGDFPALDLGVLSMLSDARQKNALRYWLADKCADFATSRWQGWYDLRGAKEDAQPVWQLPAGTLVRYRQQVYWLEPDWFTKPPVPQLRIDAPGRYPLKQNGWLVVTGEVPGTIRVDYRRGGEQLQLEGRGRRDLKRLLQELQAPWFLRQRIPLLYLQDELIAIAGYPAACSSKGRGLQVHWQLQQPEN